MEVFVEVPYGEAVRAQCAQTREDLTQKIARLQRLKSSHQNARALLAFEIALRKMRKAAVEGH